MNYPKLLMTTALTALISVSSAYAEIVIPPSSGLDVVKISIKPNPRIESANGDYRFEIGGYLQADGVMMQHDVTGRTSGSVIRNARISLRGVVDRDWHYMFENNFANNYAVTIPVVAHLPTNSSPTTTTTLTTACVRYKGLPNTIVTVGQFNEPINMENLVGPNLVIFSELAAIYSFVPPKHLGLAVTLHNDLGTVTAGAFGNNSATGYTGDQQKSLTGRLTLAPVNNQDNLIHLGIAASHAIPEKIVGSSATTQTVTYKAYPDNGAEAYFLNTGALNVTSLKLFALEAAAIHGPFLVSGEYIASHLATPTTGTLKYYGYYAQASWMLTGEKHSYDNANGYLGSITPDRPFNLAARDYGAWELAARYNVLNLNDVGVGGTANGKMNNVSLALNWYVNNYVRFVGEYTHVMTDNNAPTATKNDNSNVYLLRMQLSL